MVVRIQSPKKSTLESDLNSALCLQHSTAQCSWFLKRLINPMGMEITIQVMERMTFMNHDFSSSSSSSSSSLSSSLSSSWEVEERNRILLEMEKRLRTQEGKAGSGSPPTLKQKGLPGCQQQSCSCEGTGEKLMWGPLLYSWTSYLAGVWGHCTKRASTAVHWVSITIWK